MREIQIESPELNDQNLLDGLEAKHAPIPKTVADRFDSVKIKGDRTGYDQIDLNELIDSQKTDDAKVATLSPQKSKTRVITVPNEVSVRFMLSRGLKDLHAGTANDNAENVKKLTNSSHAKHLIEIAINLGSGIVIHSIAGRLFNKIKHKDESEVSQDLKKTMMLSSETKTDRILRGDAVKTMITESENVQNEIAVRALARIIDMLTKIVVKANAKNNFASSETIIIELTQIMEQLGELNEKAKKTDEYWVVKALASKCLEQAKAQLRNANSSDEYDIKFNQGLNELIKFVEQIAQSKLTRKTNTNLEQNAGCIPAIIEQVRKLLTIKQ